MRGSDKRDSVDTAKHEKSFAKSRNNKMLTISEVFGMNKSTTSNANKLSKGSKNKSKTMRNVTS